MELVPDPPENALARALRLAAADPAARPAFYAALLDATVYVIGPPAADGPPPGDVTLKPGDRLRMTTWERETGEPVVPFFTSAEALAKTLTEPATFVALPARGLFALTAGAWLVLNPGHGHGKEFSPDEVAALLADGTPHAPRQRVLEKDTTVMIGEPAQRPEALLAALARFFATRPAVAAARLGLMHDPASGEAPALMLGITADIPDDAVDRLMHEIGTVAADAAPEGMAVDMVRVEPGGGHLSFVAPFYEKAAGGGIARLLGF